MNFVSSALSAGARNLWRLKHRRDFSPLTKVRRKRLLVDVSVLIRHDARTGIQRVVRAFWTNLVKRSGPELEILPVYATRRHGFRYADPAFLDLTETDRHHGSVVKMGVGDQFLGLDLNAHLMPLYTDQLSAWRTSGGTINVVVYDLLPILHPEWFNRRTVENFRRWFATLCEFADRALCISNEVAAELRGHLAHSSSAPIIDRIQLGGDLQGSRPSTGVSAESIEVFKRISHRKSILMVGTIEPRKAHDVALNAFDHLWSQDPDAPALVIVGKPGWQTEEIQNRIQNHPQAGDRLFWLQNSTDEELSRLYDACTAVFLPSKGEGFGLPAIEAAVHGRHVLVRDLPVFREQRLKNLLYFDDDKPAAVACAINSLVCAAKSPPPDTVIPRWSDCVDHLLTILRTPNLVSVSPTMTGAA